MAKVNVGVVGQAQLNAGMGALNNGGSGTGSPVTWSFIWFGVAVTFILMVYFGFGGLRGSVAS
jgi:hypothetical protein